MVEKQQRFENLVHNLRKVLLYAMLQLSHVIATELKMIALFYE